MPRKRQKDVRFTIRASTEDREVILEKARHVGLPVSELFRRAVLELELPRAIPPVNREAWLGLASLGNLLNQIALKIHMGEVAALSADMEATLTAAVIEVKRLRRELREGPAP